MPVDAKGWGRRQAVDHPKMALRVAGVAGALGAKTASDRLTSALETMAPVPLAIPAHLPAHRRDFEMYACDERDQVVVQLRAGWDHFEYPMPDAFTTLAHEVGGTVLDVGANTGLYAILATFAHPSCTAVAFEPFPPVVALLRRNLALNRLSGRVKVVEQAVSDSIGTANLFVPDPVHGLVETSC